MSVPLPNGMELTAVAAVAIALSLAGMWLSRLATSLIGHASGTPASPSPLSANRPAMRRLGPASTFTRPDWLQRDRRAHARSTLRAALNGAFGKISVRRSALRQHSGSVSVSQQPKQKVAALPPRVTIEAQWERTANVIGRAVTSAHMARAAHVNAGDKLDAAHYAFDKLLHELEGLVSLNSPPAELAILSRASNVVSLRNPRSVMAARAAA
jgi:hypothetical protein